MKELILKYNERISGYSKARLISEITLIIFLLKGLLFEFSKLIGLAVSITPDLEGVELWVGVLIIAPLSETAIFQGLVLWTSLKFTKTTWIRIAISASAFTAIHYDVGISDLIQVFPAGIFFAWVYLSRERNGDAFLTTALVHFFLNLISLIGLSITSIGILS